MKTFPKKSVSVCRAACTVPDSNHVFEVYTETDIRKVYKAIGKILSTYMQVIKSVYQTLNIKLWTQFFLK